MHLHHAHRAAQPDRRRASGHSHSVPVPRQRAQCAHRRLHHSLLAALRRHPARPASHPGEPAFAGRARLRHGRRRLGRHGGEHPSPHVSSATTKKTFMRNHRRRGSRSAAARSSSRASSSSFPICRSSPCSASKAASSAPWPGPWPSPCSARWSSRCSSHPCSATIFFSRGHQGMAQPGARVAQPQLRSLASTGASIT